MKRFNVLISTALLLFMGAGFFAGCTPNPEIQEIGMEAPYVATPSDLAGYWAESSRTVREGDFEGYAATYHRDAVLVDERNGTSYPIATALAGWKPGFDDTASGAQTSDVEFRFSRQISDSTTAHSTGIFHYTSVDSTGAESGYYIHFEGLLFQKNGWKMMMEYQKSEATLEEWDALQD